MPVKPEPLDHQRVELADEEDESLMDERRRAELEDLEDELAVLAGMREDVADEAVE